MEQILYNIVLNLLKGNKHLRQIAKELNVNHMTVKRALDLLVRENVLDVSVQGKNNIFSIKKTLEARNFILMAEIYNLNIFISKHPPLKQDLAELKKLDAGIIAIFGSYAKGIQTSKSDIDVYIDTQSNKVKKQAEKINDKFSVKIGSYNKDSLLIKEIEQNHVIVKGVEEFYEKNKFFG
ncbi:nucleotidyltransferase domain-containing protein [Candidatus Woesearchaeota archaeon]|nr:nucleotidyltransferase domain-containing protein [Candidatus Woesearchaeota archaeon]